MIAQADLDLLDRMAMRFNEDYFIRSLGDHGLFCMPNFVATAAGGKLSIQLLAHVTEADEAQIRAQLAGLPYEISSKRLTLEDIEQRTGTHFPDVGDDENEV